MVTAPDVLIIGGGWSGLAAAVTLARGGAHPLVLDRAPAPGASSPQGGVVPLRELAALPGDLAKLPVDRILSSHRLALLGPSNSVAIDVQDAGWATPGTHLGTCLSVTALPWMAERARAAGAEIRSGTSVGALITDTHGRVTGVETTAGRVSAPLTLLAGGPGTPINNLPPLGSTVAYAPPQEAVAVELHHLGADRVTSRFTGPAGSAPLISAVLSFQSADLPAWGWLRPGLDHVQVGIHLRAPVGTPAAPAAATALGRFRDHPYVAPFLRGGTKVASESQLISELDASRSKLCGDGVLVLGGAAGLAYSTGVRSAGVGLALRSGVLAGQVALEAVKAKDPSPRVLGRYVERLHTSKIMTEAVAGMKRARRFSWNRRLHTRYPQFAQEVFHAMMTENGQPKVHAQVHMEAARRKAGLGYMSLLRDVWAMNRWP